MTTRKLSFAVTAYRESTRCDNDWVAGPWISECVKAASRHPLVDDIHVIDDGSDDFDQLAQTLSGTPKVILSHHEVNHGTLGNKLEGLCSCHQDWVVMCDSDNIMGADFFDCLDSLPEWNEHTWYCPSYGIPALDYRNLAWDYSLKSFISLIDEEMFCCLFNTGNQFIHRHRALDLLDDHLGPRSDDGYRDYFPQITRDSIERRFIHDAAECAYMNSRWLMDGNWLKVVPGLEYQHRCDLNASAFMDAPELKKVLPPIYFMEMEDNLAGHHRKYQYHSDVRHDGILYYTYTIDGDKGMISVNPQNLADRRTA